MAQIAFSALGQAAGSALLPTGIGALGFQVSGAAIGQAIGGFVGSRLDGLIFGNTTEGPRIESIRVMESREGAGIPNIYGRARVGGQVIWAARLRETRTTESAGGGKGGPRIANFTYAASFAVALGEGPINRVLRVWANGEVLALGDLPHRLYRGGPDQLPDPLIEAIEGADCAPAYRDTAYIVFEDLPLEQFGNRLPQLSFEVLREVSGLADAGVHAPLSARVSGVNLIPASGEFVYGTVPVRQHYFPNIETPENTHTSSATTDMVVSLDQLQQDLPLVRDVALTVGWFGTDLRAGQCQIMPGVETREKDTRPYSWTVNGLDRGDAKLISGGENGAPNYGGTPADQAVIEGIRELNARGMNITMSPFLFMDVPEGNGLEDPYGGSEQAAFPWRGRITDIDGSAQTRLAVDRFLGQARAADFDVNDERIRWDGDGDDYGFCRFVLHQAWLAKVAGGVEAFLVGSEMRGLTRLRDETGRFPFVEGLVELAAEVRGILGPQCRISYAADWTEYGAYVPSDGSNDVLFPLDQFWSDDNVDFVGVDWYPPVGDWRSGTNHLDAEAGYLSADDPAYLLDQMTGGEAFDWFYASDSDRDLQIRTPINDTAHAEHWVFRQKDLLGWWNAAHHERPNGARAATSTAWVPASKPIRLSEIGFPALDSGGNSPNLFFDPKSSESAFPPYSTGERDDLYQRAALDVALNFWQGQPGVEQALVWAWDARPWPFFPIREDIWSDGPNWAFGHWLNGRAGLSELGAVLTDISARAGVRVNAETVTGIVEGFVLSGVSTLRSALQPLVGAFGLDMIERDGELIFSTQDNTAVLHIAEDALTEGGLTRSRRLLDKVPGALRLTYVDGATDYQPAMVEARNPFGDRGVIIDVSLPLVLTETRAQTVADFMLSQTIAGEDAAFGLSLSQLELEAGDGVQIDDGKVMRVAEISEQGELEVQLRPEGAELPTVRAGEPVSQFTSTENFAVPGLILIDGPRLPGFENVSRPLLAGIGNPWPGPIVASSGAASETLTERAVISDVGGVGRLLAHLPIGPLGRWDDGNELVIEMPGEQFFGLSQDAALSGAVPLLIGRDGDWELVAYQDAELIGPDQYRLTRLLRGLQGSVVSEHLTGAVCVIADSRLVHGNIGGNEIGTEAVWQASGRGLFGEPQAETFNDHAGLAFSPGHLRARKTENGSLYVSWIRRAAEIETNWVFPEQPNEGRFHVVFRNDDGLIFQTDVDEPEILIESAHSGEVINVREYGPDGRLGRPASLQLTG